MSAINANTVIELFGLLPEADKTLVRKAIAPNSPLIDGKKQTMQVITPAYLLQKHRLKHKVPAK